MVVKKVNKTSFVKKIGYNFAKILLSFSNISSILPSLFYTIWIIIGVFVLILIYSSFQKGAFSGLLGTNPPSQTETSQDTSPAVGNLPGFGIVNIACVRESLSSDSISKIIENQNIDSLNAEEKEKLDKCKVEEETASPPSE